MSLQAAAVRNGWLLAGGAGSAAAALLHAACVVGGPGWYRFLGAGERIARMAERGRWTPDAMAIGIAAILALWAGYAFAGAGLTPRLPLMKPALVTISAIYLVRGCALFWPAALRRPDLSREFLVWSSAIVLALGILYAVGTWRAWRSL